MSKRTLFSMLLIGLLAVVLAACAQQPTTAPAEQPTQAPAEEATQSPAAEATQAPAAEATQAPAEEATAAPTAEKPSGEKQTYYEVNALINLPYFIDHQVGLYYAGKVFDVNAPHVGPVDYDMTAMVNTMEQAIATNPQGINIVGFDPALKPSIDAAVDAGIPVVTLDAEVYGSKRLTFLGTGNYNAGRVGGKLLAEAIGGKGKVALLTKVGQSNLEERIQGYKDEFAENYPDIELVQIIDDQSNSAVAADSLKAVLQREPDLAGVGCVEAAGGVGAATAANELGLKGKLVIVSMDRDDGTLKFIEDGTIHASVAQQSSLMTFIGTMLMYGLHNNPVPIVADNETAGVVPMPESVDTGVVVINADNAKYFYHAQDPYDFSQMEVTPPAPDETYVEVLALINLPYFIDHRLGLEFAGKELGVKTKFVGPVDYDMTAMINTLEQTIAEKPAGILVVGFDPALKPSIDAAIDAGIPVVTLDAEVYGSKRLTFLGTGNYNAGRVGGKLLAEAIGGKGKVAILTKVGQSNLEERIQGYKDELAENYPAVELVQIIDDQSNSAIAADSLKALLQREPDLAGVGCVEAAGGVGAATASNELGLKGKLKIISMDRDDGTLKFIEDGTIVASVAQKTALMSYLGTKLMYYLNHAPVPVVPDNKAAGIVPMPESVDTGTIVINKDNAKFFYHQ
ncbi:MAG: substrate-binding domain-containing protein [Caldilineales bacterium]|nr:substrate-binding domain-containing protein [Caldilineales bacterium]MCW5858332.1 substrate-binding domain-containing protein [Caldilineales bacterium]